MKIKHIILGIVIAAIFLMFAIYGTKLFYEKPTYDDFCDYKDYQRPVRLPETNCASYDVVVDALNQACYENKGSPTPIFDSDGCQISVECDYCRQDYEKANEDYGKNLFIIGLIVGVLIIALSAFLVNVASVAGGLMFGAFMFIIYGTARYWQYMEDWLRFILLGIALGVLIFIGYRLAKKDQN